MKEKIYEVTLYMKEDDPNFASTCVSVCWDDLLQVIRIFSNTHIIAIDRSE